MNCHFLVWSSSKRLSYREAQAVYLDAMGGSPPSSGKSIVPLVLDFVNRYPTALRTLTGGDLGDEGLSEPVVLSQTSCHAVFSCGSQNPNPVKEFIRSLAAQHQLVFFDVQSQETSNYGYQQAIVDDFGGLSRW